jgi:enoyl-CoA hydratase
MSETPAGRILETHRATIDACFAADTVEEILQRLDEENTPFSRQTIAQVRAKSPTSLKLALKLLRLSRSAAGLEECLTRELGVMLYATTQHDVVEGIRAAVIDKDRNPKWQPARLSGVSEAQVSAYLDAQPPKPIPFHRPRSLP